MENPFNVTKATYFSDKEIQSYWVDYPEDGGFVDLLKPNSHTPMMILGGKGSGKTHLMRFFSYPLQKIKHSGDILLGISKDRYLGIYTVCGGLNASRFQGKGIGDDIWLSYFCYRMELWISHLVVLTLKDIVANARLSADIESKLVLQIGGLFDIAPQLASNTLEDLSQFFSKIQRELDFEINNCHVTGKLASPIKATLGVLIFGVPKVVISNVPSLQDCKIVYLLDELETLSEPQQRFIQSLIREREGPCSLKIGSRLYGVKTYKTLGPEEENKLGSEYEVLPLDSKLRENRNYPKFAKALVASRLSRTGIAIGSTLEDTERVLEKWFASSHDSSRFSIGETAYIIKKFGRKDRPWIIKLREKMELASKSSPPIGNSEMIVDLLRCQDFPLLEKVNVFLFYRKMSDNHPNLNTAAEHISQMCSAFIAQESVGEYQDAFYFKSDLLAQMHRECDRPQEYSGLETLIDLSWGIPRHLLILLKHIFAWAAFNGEEPSADNPISIRAQREGVEEAAEWFFNDARKSGSEGKCVQECVGRLGNLFRAIRFSDKPSECSVSGSFSFNRDSLSNETQRLVDVACQWSLLVDVGNQSERNTGNIDVKLQLNRMLAPRWDLAYSRRGVFSLRDDEMAAIFCKTPSTAFEDVLKIRVARMTAPNFGRKIATKDGAETGTLGDILDV